MKIYLVHPISGLSYEEVVNYYSAKVKFCRDLGLEVLCPMTGKGYLRNEVALRAHGYDKHPASTNHAIFERDKWMVMQADMIYASFCGAKAVSIGSVMELAWASHLGKHSIVALEQENIHRHAFVLGAADVIFDTEADADVYLTNLVKGGV
jgi:nucleoside 2-deoxyribosyltransferase